MAAAEEGRVEAAGRLLLDGCTDVVEEGVVEGGVVEEGIVEEGVVEEGAVEEGVVEDFAVEEGAEAVSEEDRRRRADFF